MINPFFKNSGTFKLIDLLKELKISNSENNNELIINDIKDLKNSQINEITFFHSKKYKSIANNTKASFCLTTENLESELPNNCKPIIVDNVLVSTSIIASKFYPDSIEDGFDDEAKEISKTKYNSSVKYGKNVLINESAIIGSNCSIGHNTIIEKNVSIGDNCMIGSNTVIRNTLIKKNVRILDNCIIGKHGFGFFPNNKSNVRYPHIGIVLI